MDQQSLEDTVRAHHLLWAGILHGLGQTQPELIEKFRELLETVAQPKEADRVVQIALTLFPVRRGKPKEGFTEFLRDMLNMWSMRS